MARTRSKTRSAQVFHSKQDSKRAIPSASRAKLKTSFKKSSLPPELDNLAKVIGSFIQYWGFKSVHGKIWTLLYLSKDPLSSIEISRKLKVSKTLLSFSISDLMEYDVIQEAGKGIKRTVYFRANPNLTSVILNVLRKRERPLMGEILSSYQRLDQISLQLSQKVDPEFNLDLDRMKKMGEFISSAQDVLQSLILHTPPDAELMGQFLNIAAILVGSARE